ncbi:MULTISPECIES: PucR family transcriptional regulator [unclassified Bacillus (in: firmicutes)]|uniref:PucR family transcriptional regulator n=1 Tax=unclassified Bacillus (in: firmicutes) TaxID=185979 RepID=UPI0008E1652B|nr:MULTISPECIES: PucR family transcriptional regulator [unclassified Bacillus (in: firmicutes)]SFA90384.1 purine catabolism regulatory protein [Bacillus sp. UNCCL13]SFQ85246.1 purine catabolism regulatory protein [Bacillus sp. cl95]
MKDHFQLRISDILRRKHFDQVKIVAGEDGMQRIVKWVHVVEVTNIEKLLNGHELILSTGVAWKDSEGLFVSVLRQLIKNEAAGLCLELGTYLSKIPDEVVRIANEHGFPIIIFEKVVPFVEITQDIHSVLINQQYQLISDLENYSQTLNKSLLGTESYQEILQFFQDEINIPVIFKLKGKEYEYYPEINRQQQKKLLGIIQDQTNQDQKICAYVPIHLFGQEFAELHIVANDYYISDYELMIMDRTSTALAQHLLRDLFVEEKKRVEEFEWLNGWLEGEYRSDLLYEKLAEHDMTSKINEGLVLICKYSNVKGKMNQDATYLKLLFRSILEQQGFAVFLVEKRNQIVFILLNQRVKKNYKERVIKAIETIKASDFIKKQPSSLYVGVGKIVHKITELHKSYETAKETIRIQDKMTKNETYHFYEDLHLYRLISMMNHHIDLHEIVGEYLEPVIQYDHKHNGKLLETLKVFLECNGSKQETANKLFIVRQTLYHRLKKLESLLGKDFMDHEKRIAIEFMLLVDDYLSSSIENRKYNAK